MLTIQIIDAQLEQRILEKARAFGKTAQEFLAEFLAKELKEETVEKLPFEIPHLDWREHSHIYAPNLTDEELTLIEESPVVPFSHVEDTIAFAKQLRNNSWNKK